MEKITNSWFVLSKCYSAPGYSVANGKNHILISVEQMIYHLCAFEFTCLYVVRTNEIHQNELSFWMVVNKNPKLNLSFDEITVRHKDL